MPFVWPMILWNPTDPRSTLWSMRLWKRAVELGDFYRIDELNTRIKSELLCIPAMDVMIDGKQSPLMNAMSRTTNSLYECFLGSSRKLLYPELE